MSKELIKMREIRKAQVSLRKQLKQNEDENKALRNQITPIWGNKEKAKEVASLDLVLVKGRARVRSLQIALRELKHNLRTYNKQYDNIQFILKERNNN